MIRTLLLVSLLLMAAASAPGQDAPPGKLNLRQAVDLALENSHRLKAADAGVLAAEAGVEEAEAARLPRLEFEETFLRTDNPVAVFGNLLRQGNFTEENFDIEALNHPDPLSNFNTRLDLFQPVWTGGRIAAGLEAAEHGAVAAAAGRERTRQEVVHQVVRAFSNVIVAGHQLSEAEASLDTVRSNLKLVTDLFETGMVVESDLLQAQVRESELQELVIRAESAVAVSRAALNLILGQDVDRRWELAELDAESLAEPEGELASLALEARSQRPDLQAAAAGAAAAHRQRRVAKAGYFPRIGLGGGWEANAEDGIGNDGDNWSVMVRLQWTAFDGFATRSRVRRAEQEAVQADEMRYLLADQVALEVRRAWYELEAAGERRQQAARSLGLAERNLIIVRDRYREGLANLVELQEAETALTRARARGVAALGDVLVSRATLELATGRL